MTFRLNSMQTRILFLLIFLPFIGISQSNISEYHFTFEDTTHEYFMYRDTISNPNCIWQVGEPQKTVFTASVSQPNAIVTDTINSYPINDTSSFIIKHEVGQGFLNINGVYPIVNLSASYYVNSDTLNDFGKIEFSPDNGESWILISDDTLTLQNSGNSWPYIENNPIFTGNSNGWEYFNITLSGYDQLTFNIGDTVQYRFTFISDGNFDNKDGLMFDNIMIRDDMGGGLNDLNKNQSFCFPNPFSNQLTFEVNNKTTSLTIYDINGKTVYTTQFKNQSQIKVNTSYFKNGIYFYELSDKNGVNFQRGKVVKN